MHKQFMEIWGYFAVLVFLVAVVGSIIICNKVGNLKLQSDQVLKKKQYSHELADNVRYFDYEFIDRELFTFKNCRIKK